MNLYKKAKLLVEIREGFNIQLETFLRLKFSCNLNGISFIDKVVTD